MTVPASDHSRQPLRQQHYNATAVSVREVTAGLIILRVKYDHEKPTIAPGQFVSLGLGNWEPRVDRIVSANPDEPPKLIRRAYSVSCPLLEEGRITGVNDSEFLEFCIRLVDRHSDRSPMLTPRLFLLRTGDRISAGEKPHGTYTLKPAAETDTLLLLATGTGEAPHTTMIAELLSRGHRGRIVCATCVRYHDDLAYLAAHRQLESRFSNYRYVSLTTREATNTDRSRIDFKGKQYLQSWIESEEFRSEFGDLTPETTQVYLCGSPAMIGLPTRDSDGSELFPEPVGMVEILSNAGFRLDTPRNPGNIHVEKYW